MKHTFDETTMQAAIDAACEALGKGDFRPTAGLLDTVPGCSDWSQETHARLYLAEKLLELLPESCELSTLRPISEAGEVPDGCVRVYYDEKWHHWNQIKDPYHTHFADIRLPVEAPIVSINTQDCEPMSQNTAEALSAMIQAAATPQTFEEQGKTWNVHTPGDPMPCDGKIKIDILDRSGVVYCDQPAHHHDSNFWTAEYCNPIIGWRYADEPSGKSTSDATITPWTPAVGNVVTLKSGSPKMTVTVLSVHKDNASVSWFNDGVVNSASFNVSTLIPA